jgi:hypothetical protein
MASLRRTMTRTRTRARSRGNPNAHLRQRGKRAARPNIASMLTTVEWPTRLVSFSGRAFDDAAFPARKEAWLVEFMSERESYRHAPNRERWMPNLAVGQIGPVDVTKAA